MNKHQQLSVWQECIELAALTEELSIKLERYPHLKASLLKQSYIPALTIAQGANEKPKIEFIDCILDALDAIRNVDVIFSIGEQLEVFSRANRDEMQKQIALCTALAQQEIKTRRSLKATG